MKRLVFAVLYLAYVANAKDVIYKLSDEDFHRMPNKYHLDRFQQCLAPSDGTYCTVWADLVSDQPSELLDMVQAYSAHDTKHFNYSNIKYGLCLTKTCKHLYTGDRSHEALWNTSEACLNESVTKDYDLQARVTDIDCYHHGHQFELDSVDQTIVAVLAVILALNVAGSTYDWFRDPSKPGNKFLVSFSIIANYKSLMAPGPQDPEIERLRCFNGIRALTALNVVVGHLPFQILHSLANLDGYEQTYKGAFNQILVGGHVITQTFFATSGFFLAYNMEKMAEKTKLRLRMLPRMIFTRWLRLTPANLVAMLVSVIWYKFVPAGPLLKELIIRESSDCRNYWLYNMLYIVNMVDHTQCNLQVWFLATDMQLHIIGLTVILMFSSKRIRYWALATLILYGMGYIGYLVYTLDLDGTYLPTPNTLISFCLLNPAFNWIFKTTIANMPSFVLGMGLSYIVYNMQKKGLLKRNYVEYRTAFYVLHIITYFIPMAGSVFYMDGPRQPLPLRVAFAMLTKPIFGLFMCLHFLAMICRVENPIRAILEWNGWLPLTRLSYCIFLTHMIVIRHAAVSSETLGYLSGPFLVQKFWGTYFTTIITAALFYLLVEAPFSGVHNAWRSLGRPAKQQLDEANGKKEIAGKTD